MAIFSKIFGASFLVASVAVMWYLGVPDSSYGPFWTYVFIFSCLGASGFCVYFQRKFNQEMFNPDIKNDFSEVEQDLAEAERGLAADGFAVGEYPEADTDEDEHPIADTYADEYPETDIYANTEAPEDLDDDSDGGPLTDSDEGDFLGFPPQA